ncbi:hypothetical protein AB0O75_46850 [Streptomyces sp. NPDC088921]|uniref:hypothetical protein n=1 Tax=unclassified Streptomyces TaxID=2593676 RepID=UPI00343A979D
MIDGSERAPVEAAALRDSLERLDVAAVAQRMELELRHTPEYVRMVRDYAASTLRASLHQHAGLLLPRLVRPVRDV